MKKILTNRWFLLALGILIGAYLGGDLALRYANSQKIEYDEMLQDHFVESRIWNIAITLPTLEKAENGNVDWILNTNQMLLRGAFLALVEIHKTGDYPGKEDEMVKSLARAKNFMMKRPSQFLDMEFFVISADRINNPEKEDTSSNQATDHPRQQLKEAFEYVDGLQKKLEENGEPTADENALRPTA